jgi:hypothetical protein
VLRVKRPKADAAKKEEEKPSRGSGKKKNTPRRK